MPELLLLTGSFPHDRVTEFLDREITFLAESFDSVRVAPARPSGPRIRQLPTNVSVDYSLAEALAPPSSVFGSRSRAVTAAGSAIWRSGQGFGATSREVTSQWRRPGWITAMLLSRADAATIASWASRSRPPDVAYTFWLGPETAGLRAAWPSVPLVSRAHGGDVYAQARGWRSIPFQAKAVAAATMIACASDNGCQHLRRTHPMQASAIVTRRLGTVDLGGLARAPDASEPLKILSASSLDNNKRVDLIAGVAADLARRGRAVSWTHLGEGPGRLGVDEALAGAPDVLTANLPGQVAPDVAHQIIRDGGHHVFINLSLSEGAPVSVMEAQCVGLPVVATDVGGTSEVAPAALNALVGPDWTAPQVADALIELVARDRSLADARRQHWQKHFNCLTNYNSFAAELRAFCD